MRIAVLGLWHLGEIYSACLAELGHRVIGIDDNKRVVDNLQAGSPPVDEPSLSRIIRRNIKKGRLFYSTDYKELEKCDVLWMTIDTPIDKNDKAATEKLFGCLAKCLPFLKKEILIVFSSQLPVGTSAKIIRFIHSGRRQLDFKYAYIPENLRLGEGVKSFLHPSRTVIGVNEKRTATVPLKIFCKLNSKILVMSVVSAEMVKHATNSFLATSLSFIYDISDICEVVGADIMDVSKALKADERIGERAYLDTSTGFSGGTLGRDLNFLISEAQLNKITVPVISAVNKKNRERKKIIFSKILPALGSFKKKKIAIFGLTYKPGTPALRRSLPLETAKELFCLGSTINLFDPSVDKEQLQTELSDIKYNIFDDPYKAVKTCNAVIFITPSEEMKKYNLIKFGKLMNKPKIFFDARNYFVEKTPQIKEAGFKYIGIGR